jgi:DNA-binding response OmpR family regulator
MPTTTDPPEYHLLPDRSAVQVGPREVVVTPTQFRLLAVLMSEPGRSFSRAELVEKGIGDVVDVRTVDVHIRELRRKLDPDGGRIETVRRVGYRYRGSS